jgi:hypothetical protein
MFQIETWTGTGPTISLFLIEMAAATDVVLQYGVCRQEYLLLDDYYKHQCADNNNNNVSGKCFYFTKRLNIYKYEEL